MIISTKQKLNFQGIPLDVKGIAFDMAEGCLTEIKEIFFLEGKYPPIIRWCSYAQEDWPKPHQILSNFWRSNNYIDEFSIEKVRGDSSASRVIPYLVHLKRKGEDDNFEFTFVGERAAYFLGVSENYNEDLVSILERNQKAQDLFNLSCLSAAAIRGQGMLVLSQDGTEQNPILWNKMILPLIDRSGRVNEFIMCVLRMPPK